MITVSKKTVNDHNYIDFCNGKNNFDISIGGADLYWCLDDYYLAENVKPNDKLLPFGGRFNEVSKEVANTYYNDEEKFEEVLECFQRVIGK